MDWLNDDSSLLAGGTNFWRFSVSGASLAVSFIVALQTSPRVNNRTKVIVQVSCCDAEREENKMERPSEGKSTGHVKEPITDTVKS